MPISMPVPAIFVRGLVVRRLKPVVPAILFFALLFSASSLSAPAARADDRDDANRYYKHLEEMQQQADRDRENYARLHETGKYAAIAYSPATGKYGYSFDYGNLQDARKRAVEQCKANDARVVVWMRSGYCALAKGKDGLYGWGYGATASLAQAHALAECKKRTTDCSIVTCVYSGR